MQCESGAKGICWGTSAVILGAVSVLALAGYGLWPRSQGEGQDLDKDALRAEWRQDIAELKADLTRLQEQMDQATIAATESRAAATPHASPSPSLMAIEHSSEAQAEPAPSLLPATQSRPSGDPTAREERIRQEAKQIQQYVDQLEDQLGAEEYDGSWAPGAEESLRSAIVPYDSGQLIDIQCRASLCRLEIGYAEEPGEEVMALESDVLTALGDTSAFTRTEHRGNQMVTIYYIARPGQNLPNGGSLADSG